jgi:hypothetical protein
MRWRKRPVAVQAEFCFRKSSSKEIGPTWPKLGGKFNYFNVVGAGPLTKLLYTVQNGGHKREEWLAAFDRDC